MNAAEKVASGMCRLAKNVAVPFMFWIFEYPWSMKMSPMTSRT